MTSRFSAHGTRVLIHFAVFDKRMTRDGFALIAEATDFIRKVN